MSRRKHRDGFSALRVCPSLMMLLPNSKCVLRPASGEGEWKSGGGGEGCWEGAGVENGDGGHVTLRSTCQTTTTLFPQLSAMKLHPH